MLGCCCHGDASSQGISCFGINPVLLEYSGFELTHWHLIQISESWLTEIFADHDSFHSNLWKKYVPLLYIFKNIKMKFEFPFPLSYFQHIDWMHIRLLTQSISSLYLYAVSPVPMWSSLGLYWCSWCHQQTDSIMLHEVLSPWEDDPTNWKEAQC